MRNKKSLLKNRRTLYELWRPLFLYKRKSHEVYTISLLVPIRPFTVYTFFMCIFHTCIYTVLILFILNSCTCVCVYNPSNKLIGCLQTYSTPRLLSISFSSHHFTLYERVTISKVVLSLKTHRLLLFGLLDRLLLWCLQP